jgi:hypothetical protein
VSGNGYPDSCAAKVMMYSTQSFIGLDSDAFAA